MADALPTGTRRTAPRSMSVAGLQTLLGRVCQREGIWNLKGYLAKAERSSTWKTAPQADVLSEYHVLLKALVLAVPDCVLPIKPLETALRNMYDADVREAGAIRLVCDATSNPRHEAEDVSSTMRMLLSKLWWVYSSADAQRRCLDKASVQQLRNITDILATMDDARRQQGLPSRAAPSYSPRGAAALLAITNGESADSVAGIVAVERPRPSRSASLESIPSGHPSTRTTAPSRVPFPACMGAPNRAGHSRSPQRRGSRSPLRQRRGASPSRARSSTPLHPPQQNQANANSPQFAWAFGGCVRLGSTVTNLAITMRNDAAQVITTECVTSHQC